MRSFLWLLARLLLQRLRARRPENISLSPRTNTDAFPILVFRISCFGFLLGA
jgi:hypothetical protein